MPDPTKLDAAIERLHTGQRDALDALEFAEGAILDAIGHEDGLDGATGYVVLKMIWKELATHGRDRTTTDEAASWLEGQYNVPAPHDLVSRQNRKLEAEVERLRKLEGADSHPEDRCDRCGGRNITWYTDSALWHRVAATFSILCPICFAELASQIGIMPTTWRLSLRPAAEPKGDE